LPHVYPRICREHQHIFCRYVIRAIPASIDAAFVASLAGHFAARKICKFVGLIYTCIARHIPARKFSIFCNHSWNLSMSIAAILSGHIATPISRSLSAIFAGNFTTKLEILTICRDNCSKICHEVSAIISTTLQRLLPRFFCLFAATVPRQSFIFAVIYPRNYHDKRDNLPFQLILGKLGV
jgi:hypothetical protein